MREGRTKVRWVCRRAARGVASTVMRADQLLHIARTHVEADGDFEIVDETMVAGTEGALLWLTKGFLQSALPDEIASLRGNGNVLCADYVDAMERDDLNELVDVYVASSIRQLLYFRRARPEKPSFPITHHADLALTRSAQQERFRIGYFGELANAAYQVELVDAVDFTAVDTRAANTAWVDGLRDYSFHYAVRQQREFDGFKPFTKGFTAATCGAAIIVPLDESDARFYLGPEYPYVLRNASLPSVREMLDFARGSFGGPEWRHAQTIMDSVRERCSPRQVATELGRLFAEVRS